MTILDLGTCALLIRLLRILRLPAWRAVLYAWHPLPVLEIAASGHIDGAGVFFLMLTLVILVAPTSTHRSTHFPIFSKSCRGLAAGLVFSGAVLTKLLPLVFFPGLLILTGRSSRKYFCGAASGGCLMLILPFCPSLANTLHTLRSYAQSWEFSGFLYRLLAWEYLSGPSTRLLLAGVYAVAMVSCYTSEPVRRGSPPEILRTFYGLALVFLLLTPTLFPWYALYLAAFLPMAAGPTGLILSWSVLLSYRILLPYHLLGRWIEDDLTPLMIWAPALAVFLLTACLHLRARLKTLDQAR